MSIKMETTRFYFIYIVFFVGHVQGWVNDYDRPFTFTCPGNTTLYHIQSIHDNHHEDRVFAFSCKALPFGQESFCQTTDYINDFDQLLIFQCPHASAVTGISSYHDNHHEDRRFRFRCCEYGKICNYSKARNVEHPTINLINKDKGLCMSNCRYSGFVNRYDGALDYTVPAGYVLRGVSSAHDNHREDRIFDFEECELREC